MMYTIVLDIFNTLTAMLVIDRPPFLLWRHGGHWWPEHLNFLQL